MEREVKMLFVDLEVSRDIVEGYGNTWEFKVVKTIRHQELMSYAYKWQGQKKIHYVDRHQFDTYKEFVQSLWDKYDESDIVVAHNANRFDNKMANRFFIKEGLTPPSPYRSIDTLQIARSYFKFQSNSLNNLAEYLGLGSKEKITYADLEADFMSDSPSMKTRRAMKKYNIQDIVLLEAIYMKLRPYVKNHPNMAIMSQRPNSCTTCGATTGIQSRGTTATNSAVVRIFTCTTCGHSMRLRIKDKDDGQKKSVYVNI